MKEFTFNFEVDDIDLIFIYWICAIAWEFSCTNERKKIVLKTF